MTDPYRITETPPRTPRRPDGRLRPLLWLVFFVSLAANTVLSTALDNPWAGSACGLVAVLSAGALIVQHRRNR
ncbi:hypothetical protein ACIG87_01205 [Micromonospora sp. NPDC051925]|uniref:hypothetical protein n=1 Tax=Micromonospora sp. NPDC051925 TaxID=3364288 RepID=UPI0037C604B3